MRKQEGAKRSIDFICINHGAGSYSNVRKVRCANHRGFDAASEDLLLVEDFSLLAQTADADNPQFCQHV